MQKSGCGEFRVGTKLENLETQIPQNSQTPCTVLNEGDYTLCLSLYTVDFWKVTIMLSGDVLYVQGEGSCTRAKQSQKPEIISPNHESDRKSLKECNYGENTQRCNGNWFLSQIRAQLMQYS